MIPVRKTVLFSIEILKVEMLTKFKVSFVQKKKNYIVLWARIIVIGFKWEKIKMIPVHKT